MLEAIGSMGFLIVLALVCTVVIAKNMLYICQPNEVLIFSGSQRRTKDGRTVGYRIVKGGRGLRVPLLESVERMDLTNMAIEVVVKGAYSKGGIPLNVQGVANVKIAGNEPALNNAIERFLGKKREEISRIAQETLEGNLRGVLATLTPEQVNEDKVSFGQSLQEWAEQDLRKLGLVLDTLKVQNVHDDVNYLNSIGRKKNAEVRKMALIAEAQTKAQSTVSDARNQERTAIAQLDGQIQSVRADMSRRMIEAQTRRPAAVAEASGIVKVAAAKARAELEVQAARVEQVRRQLEADVVQPAIAQQQSAIEAARGDAAQITEEGRATAESLRRIIEAWRSAGDDAREIFLMQKLDSIMRLVAHTIQGVSVDQVTVLQDGGSGGAGASKLVTMNEQVKAALGVDVPGMLRNLTGGGGNKETQG